ncbi:hypothetical protein AAFA46_06900 [Oscillospiraceae bacterium WX1]
MNIKAHFVIPIILCFIICLTSSCIFSNGEKETTTPEVTVSSQAETTEEQAKYSNIGQEEVINSLTYMFGGIYPKDFEKELGHPVKVERKEHFERWYFSIGVQIDVIEENDYPMITNYTFISGSCDLKNDRGIGIGSTYEQVLNAYGDLINPNDTDKNSITVGEQKEGIVFIIKNNQVVSIYMSLGDFMVEYFGAFKPDR